MLEHNDQQRNKKLDYCKDLLPQRSCLVAFIILGFLQTGEVSSPKPPLLKHICATVPALRGRAETSHFLCENKIKEKSFLAKSAIKEM